MDHFAGLDVSVKETSVCIVDETGKIVREVRVASEPGALVAVLQNPAYRFKRIGLDFGLWAGGFVRGDLGRIKDEINRAGFKVQPAEIDTLLETHPAASEACVFGIAHAISGEIVAAAVRLAPGENLSAEALRHWCATRLRHEAIPERWFIVDKLARNERGKINRDAVRRSLVEE